MRNTVSIIITTKMLFGIFSNLFNDEQFLEMFLG